MKHAAGCLRMPRKSGVAKLEGAEPPHSDLQSGVFGCFLLLAGLGVCAIAGDYGAWEVRRARVANPGPTHGYPAWVVAFSGSEEAPTVRIDGDLGGFGGYVFVGRRVRLVDDRDLALDFKFATHCALGHRSGGLSLVVFEPAAWDALGREKQTTVEHGGTSETRSLCSWAVHNMAAPDVLEPTALDETIQAGFARLLRQFSGRELVLAVQWTAPHTQPEWAQLADLRLRVVDRRSVAESLFDQLALPQAENAVGNRDYATANRLLLDHMRLLFSRPEAVKASPDILETVDAALQNRFRSAGSAEFIDLGPDIDWSHCPIQDRQWLLHLHWHEFIPALAEAHAATGDERYLRKAIALLHDWILKNPPGTEWGWGTLHAALRAGKWLRAYPYLVHASGFTPEDNVALLHAWAEHAEYLLPESRHRPGHNFGTTQSLILTRMGASLPVFRRATLWRDAGWRRMEEEIYRSVLDDGAQVELTTSYHHSVMNSFMGAAAVAGAGGLKPSAEYWRRLERMHEYSMFLTQPDGMLPALGDASRGHGRKYLRRGAVHFDRDDMLYVASMGHEGRRPEILDTQLPSAGYYIMRTGWFGEDPIYLFMDIAHHWGGGHQHRDALAIVLHAYGRSLTPDAGAFSYSDPMRPYFQGTPAHSTVTIDEKDQNTAPATLHARFVSRELSFLDGSQNGYPGVNHRRQVLFARPVADSQPYIVVIDRLTGSDEHTVDQHVHLCPGEVRVDSARREAETLGLGLGNLHVRSLTPERVVLSQVESWVSFTYSKRESRPGLRFRHVGALPVTLATLLVPFRGETCPRIEASLSEGQGDTVVVEVKGTWGRDFVFAALESGRITVDGEILEARAGLLRQGDGRDSSAVLSACK